MLDGGNIVAEGTKDEMIASDHPPSSEFMSRWGRLSAEHSMNKATQDTLLGIVFFGALGVLLWATLNLTDLSFDKPEPVRIFMPILRV